VPEATQIGFRAYLWQFKSGVVAVAAAEQAGVAGFGLGDGSIALRPFDDPQAPSTRRLIVHADAALLCMAAGPDGSSFISGGDDGRLILSTVEGEASELAAVPRKWIEQVVVADNGSAIAYSAGKRVGLLSSAGQQIAIFEDHPSTVSGLAFNPKGKRLAVSHYGGVSLWWVKAEAQQPKRLNWKSSHLTVTWSPDGKFIMTATQENEMHGWRLSDAERLSGQAEKLQLVARRALAGDQRRRGGGGLGLQGQGPDGQQAGRTQPGRTGHGRCLPSAPWPGGVGPCRWPAQAGAHRR
jgi:WD40 repeat protein